LFRRKRTQWYRDQHSYDNDGEDFFHAYQINALALLYTAANHR
jgi:hypothetical protein